MQEGTEFLPNPVHEVEVVPAPQDQHGAEDADGQYEKLVQYKPRVWCG